MADTNTLEKVIAVVRETLDIDEDTELDETTWCRFVRSSPAGYRS